MQKDPKEIKANIINAIKAKGPSLPVQIASQVQISSLFTGAFLSELAAEKAIKISDMKVGGSPLYFISGQESMLDNFHQYLPGKEKEAFILLKQKKILKDSEQLPPIRVALRSIKDFAFPFKNDDIIFWRFHSISEQEIKEMFKPLTIKKQETKPKTETLGVLKIDKTIPKTKKKLEKSEFALNTIDFLKNQNIEILEEKETKKKEYSAKVKINSILGKIVFFCIAKDKKRLTENDLRVILQKSQALRMPALILYPNEINKKAQEYAEKWSSLLKLKKLE